MTTSTKGGARNFFRPRLQSPNHIQPPLAPAPAPSKATPAPAHAKVAPVPSPTKAPPAPAPTPVVESPTPAPTLVPSPAPALGKHKKKHKHKRYQAPASQPFCCLLKKMMVYGLDHHLNTNAKVDHQLEMKSNLMHKYCSPRAVVIFMVVLTASLLVLPLVLPPLPQSSLPLTLLLIPLLMLALLVVLAISPSQAQWLHPGYSPPQPKCDSAPDQHHGDQPCRVHKSCWA